MLLGSLVGKECVEMYGRATKCSIAVMSPGEDVGCIGEEHAWNLSPFGPCWEQHSPETLCAVERVGKEKSAARDCGVTR